MRGDEERLRELKCSLRVGRGVRVEGKVGRRACTRVAENVEVWRMNGSRLMTEVGVGGGSRGMHGREMWRGNVKTREEEGRGRGAEELKV